MTTVSVFHITFATKAFAKSARRLKTSANPFGINTFVYSPRHPVVAALANTHPEIARRPRGAGYWLWKPTIIKNVLLHSPEGSIVFYTDAGISFASNPKPLIALANRDGTLLFSSNQTKELAWMRRWTKRDAFILAKCDQERFWDTSIADASVILLKNDAASREFVDAWLALCSDRRALTDDPNELGEPNLPEFVDHRHDQSLLTLLAAKRSISLSPSASQFGPAGRPYPQVFDHHRTRTGGLVLTFPLSSGAPQPSVLRVDELT